MFKRLNTDTLNWIIIIGVVLFILEFVFFNGGLIFSALFSGLLIYIGWKKFKHLWGKVFFWIGLISLAFSILNMMAVRFLILAGIILFIINYTKSKNETERINLEFPLNSDKNMDSTIQIKPLFDNRFFGDQKTDDTAYSWRDINIYGIYGDRTIDLSNTVLPDDTAIISIRHLMGNIIIYVPYEVEVSIHHSSIFGRANILGNNHNQLMNQTLYYQTEHYDSGQTRVKITTTLLSGDIEVKRI